VVEKDGDVFGDAVNLAARVCDLASKGQIITVRETAKLLSRPFWPSLRELYKIPVKGKEEEVELLEVMWGSAVEDRTAVAAPPSHGYANQALDTYDPLTPRHEDHVGHKVEIVGMLDDDVDKTKVKTKDGKVELKTERTKKVEVPEGSAAAASATAAAPGEIKVPSFKVKVQSVRLLADTCS